MHDALRAAGERRRVDSLNHTPRPAVNGTVGIPVGFLDTDRAPAGRAIRLQHDGDVVLFATHSQQTTVPGRRHAVQLLNTRGDGCVSSAHLYPLAIETPESHR